MSNTGLLLLLGVVGVLTYLYRYAMIGLFASRSLPVWLHALCRHIAPASFAALTASALFVTAGEVTFAFDTPRPWAALVAVLVAWRTRNVLATIAAGMAALYLFKFLASLLLAG
ncbi:integrase [Thauera sp. 28]|uniref:AzlD domain-containing protein n=1 Tax=unclassified Thauera TaxID=2609274 RepID=UPI0002D01FCA|nr:MULTISPECIES: AzlD domain-containing protein [unclassified Thauera]ENO82794.1 integrase [Thauera sp. 27]ENO93690.1 integrase [Thauera sp. 28]